MPHPERSTRPSRVLRGWMLCMALGLGSAHAAVYRCGNTYQDSPCPGGQTVKVDDARTEEQREEALNAQRNERQRADDLAAERQARERQQRPATAPAGVNVRQLDALDALPADHPCAARKSSPHGAAVRQRCLNGLPVYSARPQSSAAPVVVGR